MAKERKAFNFYKSFYDVYKELDKDKDRLLFIDSILKRQFEGVEPKNLTGMVKFAYNSQKQVINQQVKGWEDKTGIKLNTLITPPTQGKFETLADNPQQQEEEKGQEEEKVEYTKEEKFLNWFNLMLKKHKGKKGCFKVLSPASLKNYNKLLKNKVPIKDFENVFTQMIKNEWVIKNKNANPSHFLAIDNFNRYLQKSNDNDSKPNMV